MNRRPSFWIAVLLAFLLNVAGSPMAWAQWLGAASAAQESTVTETSQPCHGSPAASEESAPAPDSMPCCGDGCSCAAPAVFVYVASVAAHVPHATLETPADTAALPASPLGDTLRPPIR